MQVDQEDQKHAGDGDKKSEAEEMEVTNTINRFSVGFMADS